MVLPPCTTPFCNKVLLQYYTILSRVSSSSQLVPSWTLSVLPHLWQCLNYFLWNGLHVLADNTDSSTDSPYHDEHPEFGNEQTFQTSSPSHTLQAYYTGRQLIHKAARNKTLYPFLHTETVSEPLLDHSSQSTSLTIIAAIAIMIFYQVLCVIRCKQLRTVVQIRF